MESSDARAVLAGSDETSAMDAREAFARDVRAGLGAAQKSIPCKYLYDELGSALFEAITLLPEYGVTRAEESLLREVAGDIARALVPGVMVAELGSGGGKKTSAILDAILAFQAEVAYHPIDISAAALETCRLRIGATPGVRVRGVEGVYLDGLRQLAAERAPWPPMLVLFLGSNIGNFDRAEACAFLTSVRGCLRPGDALLVGADLRKPTGQLLAAYDDRAGVTAAFNVNLLGRINRELGGDFDLRSFRHEARWSERESRVEMHLRSLAEQAVTVERCGMRVSFRAGETIWTESSYKFDPVELESLAAAAGFEVAARWTSPGWAFAESLWVVPAGVS
jgi:dimethylhistidine N-methyltransferase